MVFIKLYLGLTSTNPGNGRRSNLPCECKNGHQIRDLIYFILFFWRVFVIAKLFGSFFYLITKVMNRYPWRTLKNLVQVYQITKTINYTYIQQINFTLIRLIEAPWIFQHTWKEKKNVN